MQKYPYLPGVEQYVTDGGTRVTINNALPAALIFGWTSQDAFADGTPIIFNEPYPIPNSAFLASAFTTSSDLLNASQDFFMGCTGDGNTATAVPVLVRIGYPNKTFDATGALKDEEGSAITGAGIATCDVAEITTGEGYTGRWNGNVRVVIIDAPSAAASLNGGKAAVSFDGGLTYEYGFESIDLSGTSFDIDVPSIGLTFTLGVAAEAPVALNDGDYFEVTVTYASAPDTNDKMYKALSDAYRMLEGYDASYAIISGAYADSSLTATVLTYLDETDIDYAAESHTQLSFAYQLARFCYDNSSLAKQCLGFIGVEEPTDYGYVPMNSWIDTLSAAIPEMYKTANDLMDGEELTDAEGSLIDIGKNISIVVGHGIVQGKTGKRNAAPYVAGYTISMPLGYGPARTRINRFRLGYDITMAQANTLAEGRMTPLFTQREVTGLATYIVTGRTAAGEDSSFTKISTVRVVNHTLNNLREIANRFIGKPNSMLYIEAMKTEMQSFLDGSAEQGLFETADVQVAPSAGRQIGSIDVYVDIRAYTEIRDVRIYARFEYV